jgi:acyl-[acyl-carrier-protein]-phospholipid O-acyltransferase/long-chain-fatty-acid--[acyl-carrier-protein] ligase
MASLKTKQLGSFAWLNITQFLGALNDNFFKFLLIFVIISELGVDKQHLVVTSVTFVFVIPFLLFSYPAGVLADRISKSRIIVFTKCLEVCVMLIGCLAIVATSVPLMYVTLFLMCTQSSIFGPSKFGVVPELVSESRLSRANSLLVGATYLAIIIGTFLPSFLVDWVWPKNYAAAGFCCIGIAIAGLFATRGIEKTKPTGSGKHLSVFFPVEVYRTLKQIASDKHLITAVWAGAYFLFLGAFIQQNALLYGPEHLGITTEKSGYLFSIAAVGIGIGALIAGRLSGRNIEFGIVPIGAAGLTIACILFGIMKPTLSTAVPLMLLAGISSGMFVVPLNAFVQYQSPPAQRGQILGCQSILSFLGVALSAALICVLTKWLHLSAAACFVVVGLLTGVLAVVTICLLPDFLIRLVAVTIAKTVYRMRIHGEEHLPTRGPALIVPNHVTWVDAVLLCLTTTRRIRFVMSRRVMEGHFLAPLFRLMRCIPVSADDPPRAIATSLKKARAALDDGYLVCIFAEGALTRNGNMRGFRPGLEFILKKSDYPVIPAYIGGGWGSIFSHYHGKLVASLPKRIPYPISISYGPPMPSTSTSNEIRQAVQAVSGQHWNGQKNRRQTLIHKFVRKARQRWTSPAIADTTGKRLTFGRTLTGAIALSTIIDRLGKDQDMIGILLPSTVGGALTNIAVTLTGRVPVNLNFTASRESIAHSVEQCEISTVISSKAFLEKLDGIDVPQGTVFLEDLLPQITSGQKIRSLLKARFAPAHCLMTYRKPTPDDVATVIFSSGSTGIPKGVMLTHHNLLSNIDSFAGVFGFRDSDRVCGILPLFHSFGFSASLWCPLTVGFATHYHPNPVDGSKIAQIVREEKLTVLMTTPTFLLTYIRRATPEDFASLRVVVTGAEKLKTRVADAFEKRFGSRPREGYGTTELSPVVGFNTPDVTIEGLTQVGTKNGSIGHPIPGVALKIVDPSTGEVLGLNKDGLVHVKGPNVMLGYLKDPERTAEALQDGWYDTGDIGHIDEDGFLFLVDRLSRFSKIGGEMVPHLAVEEAIMDGLGSVNPVAAVAAAPDERKGEQLVVLYTEDAGDPDKLRQIMRDCDLPNLWKPRNENYLQIESMPTLGSGKLDVMQIKDIAKALVEERNRGT